jgi:hypothetical protein
MPRATRSRRTDFTGADHWQDTTARSLAQSVDALGKLAQMLEVPKRALWGRIPGVTQTDVQEWSVDTIRTGRHGPGRFRAAHAAASGSAGRSAAARQHSDAAVGT